ncbi:MAG: hypothetical protein DRP87_11915 [Spirochaetes bacterium]|nr:MAG: hypothetical protein DRP87_11915 [Spirochaetota bacterium]
MTFPDKLIVMVKAARLCLEFYIFLANLLELIGSPDHPVPLLRGKPYPHRLEKLVIYIHQCNYMKNMPFLMNKGSKIAFPLRHLDASPCSYLKESFPSDDGLRYKLQTLYTSGRLLWKMSQPLWR